MLKDTTTIWMIIVTILSVFPIVKSFIVKRKNISVTGVISPMETFMSITKVSGEIFSAVEKVLADGDDLKKLREDKGDQSFYVELARRSKKIIEESTVLSLLEKSVILTFTLKHLAAIIEDLLVTGKSDSVE